MSYGVKNKVTGLWFGGFDAQHNVLWVEEGSAKGMEKLVAEAQASLLRRNDEHVQSKPARIAA